MDLKSGYPYFLIKNGLKRSYGGLEKDIKADVVILGGGISGALMAHELMKDGVDCVVIDGRHIGLGSTCASTSLLQYEIDIPLFRLSKMIGKGNAEKAYHLCSEAIDKLHRISVEIGSREMVQCDSLYFLHPRSSVNYLQHEFKARRDAGFDVELLNAKQVRAGYRMDARAAIRSRQAASMDAYLFTHQLYDFHIPKGLRVFENTHVDRIDHERKDVRLYTDKGHRVTAKKLVYATGYEVGRYIRKKIVTLKSTYACVSQPISGIPDFLKHTMLWNTDDPYLYMRCDGNRIIVGGRDESYHNPERRDAIIERKANLLERDMRRIFPALDFRTEFSWTGTFGSTSDGLPYIGPYDKLRNSFFALGFGGNGITFSALAAEMIADIIMGRKKQVEPIFSFNR